MSGRRLGPGTTVSTLEDTTEPEAPAARALQVTSPQPAPPTAPVDRPRAEDLVQRRTGDIPREQINAMTPKVLELARRMGYYKLDHGLELRDQVAMAVDSWLTAQNY